jgi:hypothetical protein
LLESSMAGTGDSMLEVFRNREDAVAREAYVTRVEKESSARGQRKKTRAERRKAAGQPRRSPWRGQ